jgi:hypothetical protein
MVEENQTRICMIKRVKSCSARSIVETNDSYQLAPTEGVLQLTWSHDDNNQATTAGRQQQRRRLHRGRWLARGYNLGFRFLVLVQGFRWQQPLELERSTPFLSLPRARTLIVNIQLPLPGDDSNSQASSKDWEAMDSYASKIQNSQTRVVDPSRRERRHAVSSVATRNS